MNVAATLAGMVHGGTLVTFALLFGCRSHLGAVSEAQLVRVFRACGAILGLSLGIFILLEVLTLSAQWHPGAVGVARFAVPAADVPRVALFGAYWVSYAVLEIWTLDPCRLLDQQGVVTDPVAYGEAVRRVGAQVALNAVLFGAVVALGVV